jgi:hypothetical protein
MTSFMKFLNNPVLYKRLSANAHLPLGRLAALSKVAGQRYPHPSGFVRASLELPTLSGFSTVSTGKETIKEDHNFARASDASWPTVCFSNWPFL